MCVCIVVVCTVELLPVCAGVLFTGDFAGQLTAWSLAGVLAMLESHDGATVGYGHVHGVSRSQGLRCVCSLVLVGVLH